MKILIVEDDKSILSLMCQALKNENFIVEQAANFSSASSKVQLYEYDLVVLDLTLGDGDGLEVLKILKEHNESTPVLIVSARDDINDKVNGLEMGADDYLTKPFHLVELIARIKSIIRRNNRGGAKMLVLGNLSIDVDKRNVFVDSKPLLLGKKEYDIISFFAERIGYVISKEVLAEAVWGDNIDQVDNFDFVYAQIKNVRKKLNEANSQFAIKSIYGFGYKSIIL